MQNKILSMLEMQELMNQKIHPHWRSQEFEWYRAIWIECAELMDHYGWKWWKQQSPDLDQVILEIIDIWHFGLSDMLAETENLHQISENIERQFGKVLEDGMNMRTVVEKFAGAVLQSRRFDLASFPVLMQAIGLSFDELYRIYMGKNVLNFFRQDNGYLEGSYKKIWNGREDNAHLIEILQQLNVDSPHFQKEIYSGLSDRYTQTFYREPTRVG